MVGVMLADSHLRFTYPDGWSEEITGKAGQVMNFRRSSICRRTSVIEFLKQLQWN
jgi:hypothetical protein